MPLRDRKKNMLFYVLGIGIGSGSCLGIQSIMISMGLGLAGNADSMGQPMGRCYQSHLPRMLPAVFFLSLSALRDRKKSDCFMHWGLALALEGNSIHNAFHEVGAGRQCR